MSIELYTLSDVNAGTFYIALDDLSDKEQTLAKIKTNENEGLLLFLSLSFSNNKLDELIQGIKQLFHNKNDNVHVLGTMSSATLSLSRAKLFFMTTIAIDLA